jgi:conserved hypothetical protein TIGR00255
MPKIYGRLEDKIKSVIGSYTTRGKIELYLNVENLPGSDDSYVALNHEYIGNYLACIKELSEKYGLKNDVTVSSILSNRDIFTNAKSEEDSDLLWQQLDGAINNALCAFTDMKKAEGKRLSEDILTKLAGIEQIVGTIENNCPEIVKNYEEKLIARIKELAGDVNFEESRLLTEVAIFADKVAIDEEIVRLNSHISQFREMLGATDGAPVGRKLDFLLQEINREINTIGSKSNNAKVAKLVVEAKSEAEKIREQVQNIE